MGLGGLISGGGFGVIDAGGLGLGTQLSGGEEIVAAGGVARKALRDLIQSWIAENPDVKGLAWRSDVLGTRIFAWIAYFDDLAKRDQDDALRRAVLTSLAAQLRQLARTAPWQVSGAARLRALKGLIAGMAALGSPQVRLSKALKTLERELSVQILADGGHVSRSPSVQLSVLQDLIDTRSVLRSAQIDVPVALRATIDRMAPMLRFFRHGDRKLALFNNSIEEDGILVDLVLTRSETKGRAPAQTPRCPSSLNPERHFPRHTARSWLRSMRG